MFCSRQRFSFLSGSLVLSLTALTLSVGAVAQDVLVPLANGNSTVIGHVAESATGKKVVEFLGIPFAKPPTGRLRFKKPEPIGPLSPNPYRADKLSPSCYQTPDLMFGDFQGSSMWNAKTRLSEDCLHLNIWVPGGSATRGLRIPVMVWIYGGAFYSGSISLPEYDGKILSSERSVIVVTINYRVSVFGFLYVEGTDATPNTGLRDQQMAMKWVHENIEQFGGDASSITIFGESAGAASVSYHVLAPSSWPYFHRAIMESGTVLAPWALESKEARTMRMRLMAEVIGCKPAGEEIPGQEIVDCLRKKPADEIRENEFVTMEFLDLPWIPMVDGDFLPDNPEKLLERGKLHPGELLLGANRNESMYFVVYQLIQERIIPSKKAFFKEKNFITTDKLYSDSAAALLPHRLTNNSIPFNAVLHEYRPYDLPVTAQDRQRAIDLMLGDYHFTCSVVEFARLARKASRKTFLYLFDRRSSIQTWPAWMGALHGYEIMFVFGEPLNKTKGYSEEDKVLANKMMTYWTNFAVHGDPNIGSGSQKHTLEHWPEYHVKDKKHIVLGVPISTDTSLRERYCAFWKHYMPRLEAATGDITEAEMRWKVAFDKWENEYMRDWMHQMSRYARLQDLKAQDQSCPR